MKRLAVFALLGPPMGLIVAFWIMLPLLNWSLGGVTIFDYHQIVVFKIAYPVGIIPACLAAWFDAVMARQRIPYHVAWTAFFGFLVSFVPLLPALAHGFIHGPFILLFGFVGAVPAAVCSLLAEKLTRQATAV